MRLLGIDYGTKRVGIAISDDGGRLAFPHTTVSNNKDLVEEIKLITSEYEVELIIVGDSKNYQMKDNQIMEEVKDFVEDLMDETKIKTILHPEFMTSMQVSKEHFQATKDKSRNTNKKIKQITWMQKRRVLCYKVI
ncbi:Holliday junction resolvase RuvX [Candidatus Pacebacteria bacterium]|nr:Holliday junction resolvase RuvX [Candidatus Paceibacterota bacterium]